jgi:hypothetical protein
MLASSVRLCSILRLKAPKWFLICWQIASHSYMSLTWLSSGKYGTVWYHLASSKLWYLTTLSFVNFQGKLSGTLWNLLACEASLFGLVCAWRRVWILRQQVPLPRSPFPAHFGRMPSATVAPPRMLSRGSSFTRNSSTTTARPGHELRLLFSWHEDQIFFIYFPYFAKINGPPDILQNYTSAAVAHGGRGLAHWQGHIPSWATTLGAYRCASRR